MTTFTAVELATFRCKLIDEAVIEEVGRRLKDAIGDDARVILFGSHARGDAGPSSDLDLLVIEPEFPSRQREFVRLRKRLRGLGIPIDLIVVDSDHVEKWGALRGTMINEALREGRVLVGA